MDEDDIVTPDNVKKNKYDKNQLTKTILATGAAWLVGYAVEHAYDKFQERRANRATKTETE